MLTKAQKIELQEKLENEYLWADIPEGRCRLSDGRLMVVEKDECACREDYAINDCHWIRAEDCEISLNHYAAQIEKMGGAALLAYQAPFSGEFSLLPPSDGFSPDACIYIQYADKCGGYEYALLDILEEIAAANGINAECPAVVRVYKTADDYFDGKPEEIRQVYTTEKHSVFDAITSALYVAGPLPEADREAIEKQFS